MFEVWIG